ncbi:uncharacterized protein N7483_000576 [Penicillium malachiteum]|uniref:uncharacterized protein n=1 Tax=Penicillium malachiteum TaxID=1324776 RepID=UPI002548D794|nr:uncharacterized protein N7483_000576 [Penicillium malachiteum]KAJ5735451.1 hypothetical protein N7483_000576 [Penicillium malachiteum]
MVHLSTVPKLAAIIGLAAAMKRAKDSPVILRPESLVSRLIYANAALTALTKILAILRTDTTFFANDGAATGFPETSAAPEDPPEMRE